MWRPKFLAAVLLFGAMTTGLCFALPLDAEPHRTGLLIVGLSLVLGFAPFAVIRAGYGIVEFRSRRRHTAHVQ